MAFRSRSLVTVGLLVLMLGVLVGCSSQSAAPAATPAPKAPEPTAAAKPAAAPTSAPAAAAAPTAAQAAAVSSKVIKIGVEMPMTGTSASVGEDTTNAWKLIFDQANKSGKLPGQIQLLIQDDRSVPTDGVAVAQKLITQDHVVAYLGPFNSDVAKPVTDYTEQAKIPTILGGASATALLQRGYKYLFRINGNNAMQAVIFPKFLVTQQGLKNFEIIYQETDWGNELRDVTKKSITDLGGSVVNTYGYQPGTTDFYSLLTKVKSEKYDGIVTAALSTELGALVRQAGELGIPGSKFAAYGADTATLWKLADKASNGVVVAFNFDATSPQDDLGKQFVADYQAAYHKMPTLFAAQGWVGGEMLVAALEKCKTADSEDIANALRSLKEVPTIYGPLTFDQSGEVHPKYIFQKMQDGKLVTVGTQQ